MEMQIRRACVFCSAAQARLVIHAPNGLCLRRHRNALSKIKDPYQHGFCLVVAKRLLRNIFGSRTSSLNFTPTLSEERWKEMLSLPFFEEYLEKSVSNFKPRNAHVEKKKEERRQTFFEVDFWSPFFLSSRILHWGIEFHSLIYELAP